ncbi:MAG TPA: hypothetical protein VNJ04_08305 [Gemmatimonadaceae bacterium]|nr:hypothetical protein [Gemmatimonadaceae bacterium]
MTLAACTSEKKAAGMADTTVAAGPNDMGGMRPGSSMPMTHSDTVAQRASADIEQFASAPADRVKTMLPAHTRAVEDLIADCEQMMRDMKMTPPAKWNKATAELRSDLSRIGGMDPSQLKAFMPGHRARVEGMLEMRRDMMKM